MSVIQQGLVITINGILIVFFILFILMLVLKAMAWFAPKEQKPASGQEAGAERAMQNTQVQVESSAPAEDEEELIAVLTAAVAASLNTSTYRLNIRSYREIPTRTPVWNTVSRRENIDHTIN